MKRVLIVSPHFPPVNAPDMHRVRVSLPHFVAAGWQVTVLTVADPTPATAVDEELSATIPTAVEVVRVHCWSRRWTRWLGIGNVALRSLPFLFLAGRRLLSAKRYDVVYFSTTMFIVLPFGRFWRWCHGVPFVVDLQDPWVTDYYQRPGSPPPPGGWKYRVVSALARRLESWTLRAASHIIAVSPEYPVQLRRRYPWLPESVFSVLPFGAPDSDFARLRAAPHSRPALLPATGRRLVFAGAIGPGMLGTLEALLAALAGLPADSSSAHAYFFGTSYAGVGREQPATHALAHRLGVEDRVHESPGRLRYFDALQVTLDADVNLLFGSTDLGFTPSKILTLLAAGRPILAIAHAGSAMAERLAGLGLPCVLLAGTRPSPAEIRLTLSTLETLLREGTLPPAVPTAARSEAQAGRQLEILAAAAAGNH